MTAAEQTGAPEPTAMDKMAQIAAKVQKAKSYGVDGLSVDATTYLDRLLEISPGHERRHQPGELCECEAPEDAPETASIKWLDDTCGQVVATILEAETDRLRNAKRYHRYTPAPGFRLGLIRQMILLLAQGHIGRGQAWGDLLRALNISKDDGLDSVEQALRELNATESTVELRYPHGNTHPRSGLAKIGAPGTICDGKGCGGKSEAAIEQLLAVFQAEYRAHVAFDGVYAVPLAGRRIGRAVGVLDHAGTSEIGSVFAAAAYEKLRTMPGPDRIKQVVSLLHGRGRREADAASLDPAVLPVRVARYGDGYLLDLGGDGQYVEVDVNGWRVTNWKPDYPVMIAAGKPLPIPVRSVGEDPRLKHLGFEADDSNWHQIRIFQATAFFCDHERQQMLLTGGSGSGKSKRAESVASIIDPLGTDSDGNPVMGGPLPDDEVLGPMLLRNYLFTTDNLTTLKAEDSDRLCRIATGYRFDRRVLYTTGDTFSVIVKRPGLLTGIDVPPQLQEDAQNRMLHLELDANAPKRPSHELAQERVELGPQMLGRLLEDMVTVMKAYAAGTFDKQDRFPILACAAQAFGPEYVATRAKRQKELAKNRADADILLQTVAKVVKYAGVEHEGNRVLVLTSTELFEALAHCFPDGNTPKQWAANPGSLATRLGRHKGSLTALGTSKDNPRTGKARYVQLTYVPGAETTEIPEPPRFTEQTAEPDWKRNQRKVVGPFVGPEAGAVWSDLRAKTRDRLEVEDVGEEVPDSMQGDPTIVKPTPTEFMATPTHPEDLECPF